MNKNINNQWHPKARVKIRRYRDTNTSWVSGMPEPMYTQVDTYQLFEKGLVGKRTTWLYKSDITLEQAIASYCDFKKLTINGKTVDLLEEYPSFYCGEEVQVIDQFDRIVILHHYLNKLKIAPSKVEDAIKAGDISLCTA